MEVLIMFNLADTLHFSKNLITRRQASLLKGKVGWAG